MLFCTSAPMFGQHVAERRAHVIPHAGARKITLSVHVDIVSNLPVDVCERARPASSSPADHTGFLCSAPAMRLADVIQFHRALRAKYRDHRIALAAHDMKHHPRPRPSGARALSCLCCRHEPPERLLAASWALRRFGAERPSPFSEVSVGRILCEKRVLG